MPNYEFISNLDLQFKNFLDSLFNSTLSMKQKVFNQSVSDFET